LQITFPEGTEIGVYNGNGTVVGSGVVHLGRASVTIWGDNIATNGVIDGAIEGEHLSIKAYDVKNSQMYKVNLGEVTDLGLNTKSKDLTYRTNGLYIVNGSTPDISSELRINNSPNPFGNSTLVEFTLPESGFADITVYNLQRY